MIDKFYIGGAWVRPNGRAKHQLINPATEEPTVKIPMADEADVNAAVTAAKSAFPAWAATPREDRLALLRRLLALYNDAYDDLAELMVREMGTPIGFSKAAQAAVGRMHLEAAIEALEHETFEEIRGTTLISKEPVGVCALITPWNWPMNQLVVKAAPALAAGCTMVAKPSEFSPLSSLRFAELIDAAGFPPGVYNHITGYGVDAGEALARHGDVDMVSITGSTRAGVAVARVAADTVKRVAQELGGKSANIILPDADLARAVKEGVDACFVNMGQACRAPARMLVPIERMEEAKALARDAAEAHDVGDPMSDVSLGPVVNAAQFRQIQSLIEAGIAEGATLVTGGPGRPEGLNRGYFVRPTVFGDVTNDMTIAREEIFGPVLALIGYDSEDHAVEIANDTVYGLSGYVQSADLESARRVARRLRVGSIWINGADWDARAPFGGFKQSGNGREHGEWGLHDYLEVKSTAGWV
ncbi:aldehyde dehydrogenase family protein [Marinovum sp. 2_MG-2023]|uniref:aldehyde dehydrogenase family protein n=1 Tax=unclassified Marinovum TaxID=2647166 RepID=UPI0026E30460|nr:MULTISPECIES: aldehyde dehydrogenase family protein [unclassified Marinovum]MDO6732796.1 aldehyde dehydrogenase family protein [Marinovum sp. 2_MG-2023]MDO6782065.1 aldehyde dehydrogenase family protein [Marinovum sp. 1_MG-2023]